MEQEINSFLWRISLYFWNVYMNNTSLVTKAVFWFGSKASTYSRVLVLECFIEKICIHINHSWINQASFNISYENTQSNLYFDHISFVWFYVNPMSLLVAQNKDERYQGSVVIPWIYSIVCSQNIKSTYAKRLVVSIDNQLNMIRIKRIIIQTNL